MGTSPAVGLVRVVHEAHPSGQIVSLAVGHGRPPGLASLLSGLFYRSPGRGLSSARLPVSGRSWQHITMPTGRRASRVDSSYSSGKAGLSSALAVYRIAFACIAGKPGTFCHNPSGHCYGGRGSDGLTHGRYRIRVRITMVAKPVSLAEVTALGAPEGQGRLRPDLAFAAPEASTSEADEYLLRHSVKVGHDHPLLGVTAIDWGAQNPPSQDRTATKPPSATPSAVSSRRMGARRSSCRKSGGQRWPRRPAVARRIAGRLPN